MFSGAYGGKNEICKIAVSKTNFCDYTSYSQIYEMRFSGQNWHFLYSLCINNYNYFDLMLVSLAVLGSKLYNKFR